MKRKDFSYLQCEFERGTKQEIVITNAIRNSIKHFLVKRYYVMFDPDFELLIVKSRDNKTLLTIENQKFVDEFFGKIENEKFLTKLLKEVNKKLKVLEKYPELRKKAKRTKKKEFPLSKAFNQGQKSEEDTKKAIEGIAGKKS